MFLSAAIVYSSVEEKCVIRSSIESKQEKVKPSTRSIKMVTTGINLIPREDLKTVHAIRKEFCYPGGWRGGDLVNWL